MIIGSSVVTVSVTGPSGGMTGGTGPTGNTGATGATGPSVKGFTGSTGYGVSSISFSSYGVASVSIGGSGSVTLNLVGNTAEVNPDHYVLIKGVTAPSDGSRFFSILKSENAEEQQENIIKGFTGITLSFRKIIFKSSPVASNNVTVTENANEVIITGKNYNTAGGADGLPIGGEAGEILYIIDDSKGRGIPGTNWDDTTNSLTILVSSQQYPDLSNTFNQNFPSNFIIDPIENDIDGDSDGSGIYQETILNPTATDYQYYRTEDVGGGALSGQYFTELKQNRIYLGSTGSTELNFEFPEYRIKKLNEQDARNAFLTGGIPLRSSTMSVMVERQNIGSCCLCASGTEGPKCYDYIHKNYCESLGGNFNVLPCYERIKAGTCFPEGACCINGKCVNSTFDLCKKYNGIFLPNKVCEAGVGQGFNCPSGCPILGCCCIAGNSVELTQIECAVIENSIFLPGISGEQCNNTICCDQNNFKGACCVGQCCTQEFPDICLSKNGVFMGIGKECTEVNCCGAVYTPTYFSDDNIEANWCRGTFVDPCYEIGTSIAGGYLVGIIGEPNSCNNFGQPQIAFGEPLECMCNPRGTQSISWPFKNCRTYDGSTGGSVKYFARTHPKDVESKSLGSGCLFRRGAAGIQQLYSSFSGNIQGDTYPIQWPDPAFFKGSSTYSAQFAPYAFDCKTCNILSEIIGSPTPNANLYKWLIQKFYRENELHVLWALIIGPRDISYTEGEDVIHEFKWSNMFESRATPGSEFLQGQGRVFSEPVSTSPIDGLLNTRMHDLWSVANSDVWFRNYSGSTDSNAYDRWNLQNLNQWPEEARTPEKRNEINQNKQVFDRYYREMWEMHNTEETVIKQVSKLNTQNYNGYSDWYIPSIIEMNYITAALHPETGGLNDAISRNGGQKLQEVPYWTSTSMCRILDWSENNITSKDFYEIENINRNEQSQNEILYFRNRFISGDYGLSDSEAFNISHQMCNGIGMLVQDLKTGNMYNIRRDKKHARFRPVRRIPLVISPRNINIVDEYSSYDFKKCIACATEE